MEERVIEINKDNTVEFALFEKFTEFLYDQEIEGLRRKLTKEYEGLYGKDITEAELYYYYTGSILLNQLAVGTVKNYFNRKTKSARIVESRFKFFCEKFFDTYKKVDKENPGKYSAIEEAFIQWKSRLDKRYNVIHDNNSKEELKDIANEIPSEIKDNLPEPKDQNKNDNLVDSFLDFDKYYKSKFYNPISEFIMFRSWANHILRRLTNENEFRQKGRVSDFRHHLVNGRWEIFEKKDGKIIKRGFDIILKETDDLSREKEDEDFVGDEVELNGLLAEKDNCVSAYLKCNKTFNIIYIKHFNSLDKYDGEPLPSSSHFFFNDKDTRPDSHDSYNPYSDFFLGHTVKISKSNLDMKFGVCVMRRIKKSQDRPLYFEYPYDTTEIPLFIKTILLEPDVRILENMPLSPYSRLLYSAAEIFPLVNEGKYKSF